MNVVSELNFVIINIIYSANETYILPHDGAVGPGEAGGTTGPRCVLQ